MAKKVKALKVLFGVLLDEQGKYDYETVVNPTKDEAKRLEDHTSYNNWYDFDMSRVVEIHIFETTIEPPKVKPTKVKKIKVKKTKTVEQEQPAESSDGDSND